MAASRTPLVRLGHIRDEIADLTQALDGLTFEAFAASYVFRRTAEHAILVPELDAVVQQMIEDRTR